MRADGQDTPTLNNTSDSSWRPSRNTTIFIYPGERGRGETHFETAVVHVAVRRAVDGSLRGELQGVEDGLTLGAEGAAQLKHSLADPAGAVVHQLDEEMGKCISRIRRMDSDLTSDTHSFKGWAVRLCLSSSM